MDMEEQKRVVVDVDGVIVKKHPDCPYIDREPNQRIINKLRSYADDDFYIILYTARNMRTYEGRVGKINAETAPTLLEWLSGHDVPYDEIYYGKPWCGYEGFYIDDKAIRPSEFEKYDRSEIDELLQAESDLP